MNCMLNSLRQVSKGLLSKGMRATPMNTWCLVVPPGPAVDGFLLPIAQSLLPVVFLMILPYFAEIASAGWPDPVTSLTPDRRSDWFPRPGFLFEAIS